MDTVVLKINTPRTFKITSRTWFSPELTTRKYEKLSEAERVSRYQYLRHFVFRPPHQLRYLPNVEVFETLNKENSEIRYSLKITFSAPKLLFGNSLQEIRENDKERILQALQDRLAEVGIEITMIGIINARVASVHFCKNILLPTTIRLQDVLEELRRMDISQAFDVTEKEYKNGGRVLHIYSNTVEHVFYDKVSDALRPKVKRKDKSPIESELAIIEQYQLQNREVFRYEYRLKKTQTVLRDVNRLLSREPKTPVIFRDLFSPDLYKKAVTKSWQSFIQQPGNQLSLIHGTETIGLLAHIVWLDSGRS